MRLNPPYIKLPTALIDDPQVKLSLVGLRLLIFLCRSGRSIHKIKQEEIVVGAKLAGPRHLVRAREELVSIGWLKSEKHLNRRVYSLTLPTSHNGN